MSGRGWATAVSAALAFAAGTLLGPGGGPPAAAAEPGFAGAASAPSSASKVPPGLARPAPEAVEHDEVEQRLGQRLRCPVCQGMPIGDSPAPMAQDMMRQVRRLHRAGQAEADIVAYFTARYGDWVLLDPPARGVGLSIWLLPPLALIAGLALVWHRARGPQQTATPAEAEPRPASSPRPPAHGAAALTPADSALLAELRERVGE